MLTCWLPNPNDRPNFTETCAQFIPMLESANETYNYVDAVQNVDEISIKIDVIGSDGEIDI
jgi:hypothetical protein